MNIQGFFFADFPCFSFHGRFHHWPIEMVQGNKTRMRCWGYQLGTSEWCVIFSFRNPNHSCWNTSYWIYEYYAFHPTTSWRVWNSIDRLPFPTAGIWWPFLEEIVGTSATTVVGSLMTQSDGDNQAAGKLRKPIDVRVVEIDVLRYKVWIWMNNLRAKMRI